MTQFRNVLLIAFCLIGVKVFAFVPSAEVCEAYSLKAEQLQCGEDNYLMRFGHHYCKFISENLDLFSRKGQRAIIQIRQCLIREMQSDETLTCENSRTHAEHSHVGCYTENGFCKMSIIDKLSLGNLVYPELMDPGFRDTMLSIVGACGLRMDDPFVSLILHSRPI